MKNFRTFTQITMLAGLCIAFNQANASFTPATKIRTEVVRYNNNLIPSVQLKEVEISAKRINAEPKGAICEMKQMGTTFVASVEMKAVTINASGNYTSNDNVKAGVISPITKGTMVQAINVNGKYIPHVTTQTVEIVASRIKADHQEVSVNEGANDTQIRISVRRAFDRLANFAFEQTKNIVRKTVPAWLGE